MWQAYLTYLTLSNVSRVKDLDFDLYTKIANLEYLAQLPGAFMFYKHILFQLEIKMMILTEK